MHPRTTGRLFLLLGLLHTLVVIGFAGESLAAMIRAGWWRSVGDDPMRGMAFWSLAFGGLLAVVGSLLSQLQSQPLLASAGLLVVCLLGVGIFPASGFAVAAPLSAALLWRSVRS